MAPEEEFLALRDIFFADLGGKSSLISSIKTFLIYYQLVKFLRFDLLFYNLKVSQ